MSDNEEESEEGKVEESLTPGVNIAASEEAPKDDISQVELGDQVEITSERYGETRGQVYYRDDSLIRVMPQGVADMVYDFPVEDGKLEADLGATEVKVQKALLKTFVEQHNIRLGQLVETFTADRSRGPKFIVREVNPEEDSAVFVDEGGGDVRITFGRRGIPREQPFIVLRTRERATDTEGSGEGAEVEAEALLPGGPTDEELFEDLDIDEEGFAKVEVKMVGYVYVPIIQEAVEVGEMARRYPESLQKSDLLSDLISFLSVNDQKDNKKLQQIRSFVEQISLIKHSLINQDSKQGDIEIIPTSYMFLLDLIKDKSISVPLLRPVVDIKQKVYINNAFMEDEDFQDDQLVLNDEDTHLQEEMSYFQKNPPGAGELYSSLASYLNEFQKPFTTAAASKATSFAAFADSEVFRLSAPVKSKEEEDVKIINVACKGQGPKKKCVPMITTVPFYLSRMLASIRRPAAKGSDKPQIMTGTEEAKLLSAVLFPTSSASYMGTTRTRSLYEDVVRSMLPRTFMQQIIDKYELELTPTGKGILHIGSTYREEGAGSQPVLANAPLADFLANQPLVGFGPGDFHNALVDLGLREKEMNIIQLGVFIKKFKYIQAQIINFLAEKRAALAAQSVQTVVDKFLDTQVTNEIARDEPILKTLLEELDKQTATWSKSDIGQANSLLRKQKDLFMAIVGGNPGIIRRERDRAVRRSFLQALHNAKKLAMAIRDVGEEPKENKCKHVATLRGIRRVKDSQEQTLLLLQLLNKYNGKRKDNWVHCTVCKEHLMCEHEIIQLQMATHPREKDVLAKKLHLDFAGGIFGAHYVCRVCGQPFSEIGYDTSLEFDDEGRPMMGRDVLVDEDAIRKEEIDLILGDPASEDKEIKFGNADHDLLYKIAKTICEKVGIYPNIDGYKRIIEPAYAVLQTEPRTADKYKEQLVARAKATGQAAPNMSYETYIARQTIGSVGSHVLLEIQTKIPGYYPRYPLAGCAPVGFGGFPLEAQDDQTGIKYISCAIATITEKGGLYEKSKFFTEPDFNKKSSGIARYLLSQCQKMMTNATALLRMDDKRSYNQKNLGMEEGRPHDIIRSSFLPTQLHATKEEDQKAAESPLNEGPLPARVAMWILKGHALARDNSLRFAGSPFAETYCCLHELKNPNNYWSEAKLPELPIRRLNPYTSLGGYRIQDETRPIEEILADPPQSIYHRLFLNVCYQGPRRGYLHETGFNNKCSWCGFQFPGNPKMINPDEEGLQALQGQGVEISSGSFEELLDICHKNYLVTPYTVPTIPSPENRMETIAAIQPQPLVGWQELLTSALTEIRALPPTATDIDISRALGPLSTIEEQKDKVVGRLLMQQATSGLGQMYEGDRLITGDYYGILQEVKQLPAEELLEIIEFYFLTAAKRVLVQKGFEMYEKPNYMLELDGRSVEPTVAIIMKKHYTNMAAFTNILTRDGMEMAREKLSYFVDQLTAFMTFREYYKALLLPGTAIAQQYILWAGLIGPLAFLLDERETVPGSSAVTVSQALRNNSSLVLVDFIRNQLLKYNQEMKSYSPEQIKLIIAEDNQQENDQILKDFNEMDPAKKEVEMLQKKFGIGRWSRGNSAGIRKYDDEQYEFERKERIRAGINDFAGMTDVKEIPQDQYNPYDMLGGGGQAEGGYDNAQVAADDY
jgi:hypothetical protein